MSSSRAPQIWCLLSDVRMRNRLRRLMSRKRPWFSFPFYPSTLLSLAPLVADAAIVDIVTNHALRSIFGKFLLHLWCRVVPSYILELTRDAHRQGSSLLFQ